MQKATTAAVSTRRILCTCVYLTEGRQRLGGLVGAGEPPEISPGSADASTLLGHFSCRAFSPACVLRNGAADERESATCCTLYTVYATRKEVSRDLNLTPSIVIVTLFNYYDEN